IEPAFSGMPRPNAGAPVGRALFDEAFGRRVDERCVRRATPWTDDARRDQSREQSKSGAQHEPSQERPRCGTLGQRNCLSSPLTHRCNEPCCLARRSQVQCEHSPTAARRSRGGPYVRRVALPSLALVTLLAIVASTGGCDGCGKKNETTST